MKNWGMKVFFTLAGWLSSAAFAVAQCPMCKATVENQGDAADAPISTGLNTGILYLFVLPYLCLMVLGFLWYRGYRRKKQQAAAAA